MNTHRLVIAVVLAIILLCVFSYVMKETYLDENGAALVCYWAPQAPTMAIPIPRDPMNTIPRDGPKYSEFSTPTRSLPRTPRESTRAPRKTIPEITIEPIKLSLGAVPTVAPIQQTSLTPTPIPSR